MCLDGRAEVAFLFHFQRFERYPDNCRHDKQYYHGQRVARPFILRLFIGHAFQFNLRIFLHNPFYLRPVRLILKLSAQNSNLSPDMNELGSPDQPAAPAKASDSPYALFRNRDFSLYLIGRFIAVFGQQMLSVAVDWDIYARTHSALALGFVGLSQMVAIILFTLPAGYIADNFKRKRVILLMTFLVAVGASSLALISALAVPVA